MNELIPVSTEAGGKDLSADFALRLRFSHYFAENGTLCRRIALLEPEKSLLGVSDLFPVRNIASGSVLAEDLLGEAKQLKVPGIFLDIEQSFPALRGFLTAADARCQAEQLPLYVPERCAPAVKHAVIVCESAVSGGSLTGHFQNLLNHYGKGRVAAMLQPICAEFALPSADADGDCLSGERMEELRRAHRAQTFFSKELCAKYFTYMERGTGHFVLFDDASTMQEKRRRLTALGVSPCFALEEHIPLLTR